MDGIITIFAIVAAVKGGQLEYVANLQNSSQ
jgi:hypothetical protein